MELDFQNRLELLVKTVGSATVLAKLAGISRRTLSLYLAGKVDPTRRRLINLAKAGGVHVEWLATGWGPVKGAVNYLDEEFVRIPLLSPQGDARSAVAFGKSFLNHSLSVPIDNLVLIESTDCSMEPTIDCNEFVLVDQAKKDIVSYGVYCFRCHNQFQFRRIISYPHEDSIALNCDRYHCQKVFKKEEMARLDIVGQALFALKKVK